MTELLTATATLAPFAFMFAVAAHTPRTAEGKRVGTRSRSFTKDVRSFFGLAAY